MSEFEGLLTCPVCESRDSVRIESFRSFTIRRCAACGVDFADPMAYDETAYKLAYEGASLEDQSDYKAISDSIQSYIEKGDIKGLKGVIPAFYPFVLKAVRRAISPTGLVLDVGCGSGVFLALLKNANMRGLGMDVAPLPIQVLKRLGFAAHVGSVEDVPSSEGNPEAVCALELIEHLPDPVGFLRSIRDRFPQARCFISVPCPSRVALRHGRRESFDYPPHHLTRWSSESLKFALTKAGYRQVEIRIPPVSGKDVTLGPLDRAGKRFFPPGPSGRMPVLERKKNPILGMARLVRHGLCSGQALVLTFRGYSGTNMLAVGSP